MGFLDDLKRQADALKTRQHVDASALARNADLTEAACQVTLRYFMELAPQLNVLQLKPAVRFSLDSRTALDGFVRGDFRVDARRKPHRGRDVHDHVVLHGLQKTSRRLEIAKDFPPEIERLENRLRQAGITPDAETRRDPDHGRLLRVTFRFVGDVVLAVKLLPDHDTAQVAFRISNLDTLETVTAEFPATAVTVALLDELARWITGDPAHGFLAQAAQVRRAEA